MTATSHLLSWPWLRQTSATYHRLLVIRIGGRLSSRRSGTSLLLRSERAAAAMVPLLTARDRQPGLAVCSAGQDAQTTQLSAQARVVPQPHAAVAAAAAMMARSYSSRKIKQFFS